MASIKLMISNQKIRKNVLFKDVEPNQLFIMDNSLWVLDGERVQIKLTKHLTGEFDVCSFGYSDGEQEILDTEKPDEPVDAILYDIKGLMIEEE
ncbi:MAG: hypothetical protein ACTSSK_03585 [Candidatus Heimdallarchaeota archaeon]